MGLILLFASMVLFTVSDSVLGYVIARIFQGAATAMVTVAGLAIVTDAVDKRQLGQMIGWIGTAMTLGFMSGPVLGGVVYSIGGFYAAFGMGFAFIILDLGLRLTVIEKRMVESCISSDNEVERSFQDEEYADTGYGATPSSVVSKPSRFGGEFALIQLMRRPTILIVLWAVTVSAMVTSALDAVSLVETFKSLLHNNYDFPDSHYLRRRSVRMGCSGSWSYFHPRRFSGNLTTIFRYGTLFEEW